MAKEIAKIGHYTLYHEPDLAGLQIAAQKDGAEYGRYLTVWGDGQGEAHVNVYCKKGEYAYLTGYYYLSSGIYKNAAGQWGSYVDQYFQTTFGGYCIQYYGEDENAPMDWAPTGKRIELKSEPQYQTEAQQLVNKIIENNKRIVMNNLVCARYADKFTTAQRDQIRALQNRVQNRQEYIQKQGFCKDIQTSYPKGYADLDSYLTALMQGEAVGIATWAIVIIAAVVIAGIGTAAYFAYKSFAEESEQDIKYSKQLMAVLQQKLTPEEYQQLLDETKGIVTKAKIRQAVNSYGNVLKYAAFAVAGFAVYKFIKSRQQ